MFNLVHIFIPHCGVIKIFDKKQHLQKKSKPKQEQGANIKN